MVEIVTDYIKRIIFFRARKEYQFFIDFEVLVKKNHQPRHRATGY